MGEAIHTQVYQRFFAILFSVVPGVNLMFGLAGLTLFLIADVAEAEWGLGIGIAALVFGLTAIVWIWLGMGVREWALQKATGMLVGMLTPFLIVDAILLGYLFYDVVIADHTPEEAEAVLQVGQALLTFVA